MNRFAELLDRLTYEPGRNNKLRLMTDYFRSTVDPERGWALAALTGTLTFPHAKAGLIRSLIAERTDPVLFALSYDYVGDLSETVALMWPTDPAAAGGGGEISLTAVIETLATLGKSQLPRQLARWLDALDETGRWALIKLVTGALRIGVSARLAKAAVAALGGKEAEEIELIWPGLAPPYRDLFAWLEGKIEKPASDDPAPFRPPMLAHALDQADLAGLDPAAFMAEWKWDGIRVQAVSGESDGKTVARLYSRTGEDISSGFPDLLDALRLPGAIDGELLIMRDHRVQSFNVLQQRLNRKSVTSKMLTEFPAHLRAYDLLADGEADLRGLPFAERRVRLETFIARLDEERVDLSPLVRFTTWDELIAARKDPAAGGAGADAAAVEGVMLKRRAALYLPGRPKGPWWKWKRDPFIIDAVLMYAQRGHGKRSSFYSDYTFGVWTAGATGDELVPVGKAYFGFTDEELLQIDRFVRRNTTERFGPVREVVHKPDEGLVLEVAFEGLQRSTRHKSGLAMRFPRISRLRWDKPPGEADRLERLETMVQRIEQGELFGAAVVKRSPPATLRRGRISDVDALLALEHDAFKAEPLSRKSLRHFLISPNAAFIVAKIHGDLAGYVLVRYSSRHRLARIYSIAVDRKHRGQGLGRRLLAAADKDAGRRRCRAIRLEVRTYDRKAIRFYKSSGFRCFGEYLLYYEDRFDAFRFEKPIGGKNTVKLRRDPACADKAA